MIIVIIPKKNKKKYSFFKLATRDGLMCSGRVSDKRQLTVKQHKYYLIWKCHFDVDTYFPNVKCRKKLSESKPSTTNAFACL